jgi:hypothetical protein
MSFFFTPLLARRMIAKAMEGEKLCYIIVARYIS